MMNDKERLIFEHFKSIIENREFDEFDILGFLIFIRRHINVASKKSKYKYIIDFTHLIAHRERNCGVVMNCIIVAMDNHYRTVGNTNKVKDYYGMDNEKWVKEWKEFGEDFSIRLTDEIIDEITICVFSLSQDTVYDDKKGHCGIIKLFQTKANTLALYTQENRSDSLRVGFATTRPVQFSRELSAGYLQKAVQTVREDGRLRLKDEDGYII